MYRKGNWAYLEDEAGEGAADGQGPGPASPPWKLNASVPVETSEFKDGRRVSRRAEQVGAQKKEREAVERARRAEEERVQRRRQAEARERLKAAAKRDVVMKPRVSAPPALMLPPKQIVAPSSMLPIPEADDGQVAPDTSRLPSLVCEDETVPKLSMRPGEALKAIRTGGAGIAADLRLLHAGAAAKAAAISSLPTPSIDAPSSFSFNLDDSDSDLSSVPPSSDSEDLSSEDEAPKRKKARRRKHGLPTPSATSGSSASPPRKRSKTSRDPTIPSANDRKAYLTAGLYSTSLKQLANEKEKRRASAPPTTLAATGVFPLPINYGIYLLCPDKPRDFRLPFDIFDDYVADLGGDSEKERERLDKLGRGKKPDTYSRIRQNAYPFRKIDKSDIPPAVCFCKEGHCNDESCLNWTMQYLCSQTKCPRGEACANGPLHLRKDGLEEGKNGLQVFYTGNRGFGLRTEVPLTKGQFLMEYRGEVISRDESYRRTLDEYRGRKSFYFLDYDGYDVLDAGMKGNCARFINHSCDPNLKVMRFKLSGLEEYQIGLYALKDVRAGDELTYDYGWQNFADLKPSTSNVRTEVGDGASTTTADGDVIGPAAATAQKCFCGAANCIGALGAKKKASAEREKAKDGKDKKKAKSRKRKRKAVAKAIVAKAAEMAGMAQGGGEVAGAVEAAVEMMLEGVGDEAESMDVDDDEEEGVGAEEDEEALETEADQALIAA